MATLLEKKLSQFTSVAVALATDLIMLAAPGIPTGVSKKITVANFQNTLLSKVPLIANDASAGVTNLSTINAAIDAAAAAAVALVGAVDVVIPGGEYFIAGSVVPKSKVRLKGEGPTGSTLILRAGSDVPLVAGDAAVNFTIQDLGFYGNNENQTGGDFWVVSFVDCDKLKLNNILINRGTDGTKGTYQVAAGLRVSNCPGARMHDVEVTGNGISYGIQVRLTTGFILVDPYVHDMNYELEDSPGNDTADAIVVDGCTEFSIDNPVVHDIGGDYGIGYTTRWTRGMNFGQCSNFILHAPRVARVDQGIDLTGGDPGNVVWEIHGGMVSECHTYSYKFANSARNGLVTGCVADRAGSACFVANGPSGPGITIATGNITFVNCVAFDAGYNGFGSTHVGFKVETNATYSPNDPRGFRFIGCRAEDRQDVPTMHYGFYNETPANVDGRYVECDPTCMSIGHTVAAFNGMNASRCDVSLVAVQSIPDATWTAVDWTAEVDLGAMHSTSSNNNQINARRAGLYKTFWGVVFAASALGQRGVRVLRNGVEIPGTTVLVDASAAGETALNTGWPVSLDEADNVSIQVFQNSGGAINLQTTSGGSVVQEGSS